MKVYRECYKCHKKYDVDTAFGKAGNFICRACELFSKKMEEKFQNMIVDLDTGLAGFDEYLNNWYVVGDRTAA